MLSLVLLVPLFLARSLLHSVPMFKFLHRHGNGEGSTVTFARFLAELLTGVFGIVGDVSTVIFVASFFKHGLESFRPVLYVAVAVGFIGSAFRICQRRQGDIVRLRSEIVELKRPKFTPETRQIAETAYQTLDRTQKVALRHLLVAGDMTDRQALNYLHSKGMATNYGSIFSGLSESGMVQRVMQGRQPGEGVSGYTGNYTVPPQFKDVLTELVESDTESKA